MKTRHLLFAGFAMSAMLTSCLSEPDFEPVVEGGIPIVVDGSVNQLPTKVNAQGFEDGDALGLYAVNYENSNQTPGTLLDKGNQADHVKYIFDEKNWKWNPVRPVYYKDVNTNVDIYAFYPHAEPSSVSAYNFEVQKDQSTAESNNKLAGYEASDFLWGKSENVVPTEAAIKVKLNHMMAGALVVLEEGTGFEEAGDFALIDKKILVTGTTRKASINLADGSVTPIGEAQATGIVMAPQTDGSFRAIVVPQTVAAGTKLFSITIEGVAYSFSKSEDYVYQSGKLSQFTIKVNRKLPSGEYELELADTQIIDWREDINTHEGEARQYYCVNVTEPGTLGRLIKADNKNPDKIRNLKVSGKIHAGDIYFMRDSMAILEAVNLKETRIVGGVYASSVRSSMTDKSYSGTFNHEVRYWKLLDMHEPGNGGSYYQYDGWQEDDVIPGCAFSDKTTLYYFVFPEVVKGVEPYAFYRSRLSSALVIPGDVSYIGDCAFGNTNITSLILPSSLIEICQCAFSGNRSLSGNLNLPENLKYIGNSAFSECSFTGQLALPENLSYLGPAAFQSAGKFVGNLKIPNLIKELPDYVFSGSSFTGNLDLNNVQKLSNDTFSDTGFKGELIIPEGITEIPERCFSGTLFSAIVFPSTLKLIGGYSFYYCWRLSEVSQFPEGLVSIGASAFNSCRALQKIQLPSTLQSIQYDAFWNCHYLSSIISAATEPPILMSGAFDGVAKDNFTVEVPENAVTRYKADSQWGQFRRISAHHDFSISRPMARALNAETSKKYILRAPSGYDWSIESKPDWVTVTPSSGTGKAEVTVTFDEMTQDVVGSFEVELTDPYGNYQGTETYAGRAGEIVFLLNDKDYRSTMTVEQYDYEYGDGDALTLNTATKGAGVNLVFLADCYDAKDIATGAYLNDVKEAYGYYFDVEPYKTYKDYFNVYVVFGESDDSGMGTVNTVKDAKFGSQYSLEGISPDFATCYEYAAKADSYIVPSQTLIVMVENTTEYGGICYMWGDGSAIACCPKSADAYPYDFRGIVQHEAGGHGFGKLADEYIYHNAFIQSCDCPCCPHLDGLLSGKAIGWYRNLEATGDINEVGWSHLIFHPQYSNVVDVYEGGYFHTRGVYRSEPTSCMNNNIPYYSAISRQAIVERIMDYAGETFDLESFYALDSDEFGSTTKAFGDVMPLETIYDNGKQYAPVYMGDKPDFLK